MGRHIGKMEYFVNQLDSNYNFMINGVSYIGNPKMNTVMYVSKKVAHLVKNLENCQNCLIFAEDGIEVPCELKNQNCFIFCQNPQLSYAEFVNDFAEEKYKVDSQRKYRLTDAGYYFFWGGRADRT